MARRDQGDMSSDESDSHADVPVSSHALDDGDKAKKRKLLRYIDDLEERCRLLEQLVLRLSPKINLELEVGPRFNKDNWATVKGGIKRPGRGSRSTAGSSKTAVDGLRTLSSPRLKAEPVLHTGAGTIPCETHNEDVGSDHEGGFTIQAGGLRRQIDIALEDPNAASFERRFHGKSSGAALVEAALSLKSEITASNHEPIFIHRPKFWTTSPWEWMTTPVVSLEHLQFPPDDLASKLIEFCFSRILVLFPVVHRPTFERQCKEQLYKRDINFCRLYLLVCAIGSRSCDDERVCVKNDKGEVEWTSAGWSYFAQAVGMSPPSTLCDLQNKVLAAIYLQGTSAVHGSWVLAGIGLRFAQDIGAHREKVYGSDYPLENQLWKRSFWALLSLDRMTSVGLGRPLGAFDEDIDVELPLEVDDEYYDDKTKQWTQPPDKPSAVAFFNHFIKLQRIAAYTLRTLYSINKSKVHLGFVGPEWEARTVAEIDSALNSWLDSVPEHQRKTDSRFPVRWDPNIEDDTIFVQAAMLRLTFYYVQITAHRPFIPFLALGAKNSSLSFPSLAICTNAARSVSHILETHIKRIGVAYPLIHLVAFKSAMVLLTSVWSVKKSGVKADLSGQIADIHRCLNYLHKAEKRYHTAGRLYDILNGLATVNDVPLPETTPSPPDTSNKRRREDDSNTEPWKATQSLSSLDLSRSDATFTASPTVASPASQHTSVQTSFSSPHPLFDASQSSSLPLNQMPPPSTQRQAPPSFTTPFVVQPATNQMQWNPSSTAMPIPTPLFEPNWESYSFSDCAVPGMNCSLARVEGLGFPTQAVATPGFSSYFEELLAGFGQPASTQKPDPAPVSQQQPQDNTWGFQGMQGLTWDGYGLNTNSGSMPQ
ncbi:hypothetical protein FRB99_002259 [Tulasnella sp. 403]|nr:hypothetical protein FRB99_002259 [Tulasnella sp. 403]